MNIKLSLKPSFSLSRLNTFFKPNLLLKQNSIKIKKKYQVKFFYSSIFDLECTLKYLLKILSKQCQQKTNFKIKPSGYGETSKIRHGKGFAQ